MSSLLTLLMFVHVRSTSVAHTLHTTEHVFLFDSENTYTVPLCLTTNVKICLHMLLSMIVDNGDEFDCGRLEVMR